MNTDNDKKVHVTKIQNFYGNIGQHIDHIEYQVVHFDKDMKMHIDNVQNTTPSQTTQPPLDARPNYTSYIETESPITAIGKLIVNEANVAKTKAAFISKMAEIIRRTKLFEFKPGTTNQEKAFFTNAVLSAYGYQGDKCKHITDDDFQRYY